MLEGTDGVQKMSKSLDNAIGLTEAPEEMYGKTMSIPDELIVKYFRLAVGATDEELAEVERALGDHANPRDLKRRLARAIVTLYHDASAAERAEEHFDRVFVRHELPAEIPDVSVAVEGDGVPLARLLREAGLAGSTSEGRRLVEQGGVTLDGERVTDPGHVVPAGATVVIQAGKRRFARVTLAS